MPTCALCLKDKELADSHVIPSFIIRWLKKTSVTGFVRNPMNGNQRIQDGYKVPLLCSDCEGIISRYENSFNQKIFKTFTENYLELNGRIKQDGYLQYDEWLNKFIISIIWRSFKSNYYVDYAGDLSKGMPDRIDSLLKRWRKYLLGESGYYGKITNYLLFLRNIHEGTGSLPEDISPRIIHYLMRTIDGGLIVGPKEVIGMMKLGPIMVMTAIYPDKIAGYPNSIIKRRGKIKIEQIWDNPTLNRYLFVQRPNEFDKLTIESDHHEAQINKALAKNIDRLNDTMTMHVIKSDMEKRA
jgi:hypothetical protein